MTDRLAIRNAVPGDEALLRSLLYELAEYEKLTKEFRVTEAQLHAALFAPSPAAHALFALLDDQPVGFALYLFKFSSFAGLTLLFVEDVYVRAERRGAGIGQAIFRDLARRAQAAGCRRMEWSVLDWNAPSIAFYRGLGARPIVGWTNYAIADEALARLADS